MSSELILNLGFGLNSGDANYIGGGWSADEDGYRWMTGEWSELWVEHPGPGTYLLELELQPFVRPPALLAQRLAVFVRGTSISRSVVFDRRTLGFRIPGELLAGRGPVRISFWHPDAARPIDLVPDSPDDRYISFSMRRLGLYRISGDMSVRVAQGDTGVAAAEIGGLVGIPALQFMLGFESLGDNCEFGLVQRRCGADPPGLLRFSKIALTALLRGLAEEFEGLGTRESLELTLSQDRQYILYDRRYMLTFDTLQYEGEADPEELMGKQMARLARLRRRFLEDLRAGKKIFVCKRNEPFEEREVLPLYTMLNRFATNTLLFVVPTDAAHPPGMIERLLPNLFRGTVDRFAPPENPKDLSLDWWLAICVKAYILGRSSAVAGQA